MRGAFTWSCLEAEREGKEMPLFICIVFALLALPLSVGGAGGWLLSLRGLAWRSGVKLTVGFAYVAGVLALLV